MGFCVQVYPAKRWGQSLNFNKRGIGTGRMAKGYCLGSPFTGDPCRGVRGSRELRLPLPDERYAATAL